MYKPIEITLKNFLSHKETTFSFVNRPLILIGNNLDDQTQKGNGSGKSAIIEAISYVITGSTVRSVKDKELIMDGETEAFLSMSFVHSITNDRLLIQRTINEKKSSKCYIEKNESNDGQAKDSINEYNKYILELFGFSKDDFWNFYLITKDRYSSFFSSGDSDKKQIIDRFSKANTIDNIDFKSKIQELDFSKRKIEDELNKLLGRKEVIEEQIFNSVSKKDIVKQIEEVDKSIEKNRKELNEISEIIEKRKKFVAETSLAKLDLEPKIVKLRKDYDSKIAELKIEMKAKKESQLKEIEDKHNEKTKDVNDLKVDLELKIDSLSGLILKGSSNVQEAKITLTHIERQLKGEINCPKCKHGFFLDENITKDSLETKKDSLLNTIVFLENQINSNKEEKQKLEGELKEVLELLQLINTELIDEKKSKEQKLYAEYYEKEDKFSVQFQNDKKVVEEAIEKLSLRLREEKQKLEDYNSINSGLLSEIYLLNNKRKALEESSDEKVKQKLEEVNKSITDIEELLKKEIEKLERESIWQIRMKRFKSYLSNLSLNTIKEMVNTYLATLGSNLSIDLDGYRELANGKTKEEISCYVIRDGYLSSSYGRYSSGERGRVDVAGMLSFQHLINMSSNSGGLDLLVIDEVLDSIDSLGISHIISSLNEFNKNIILVSQNDIMSNESRYVEVTKRDRVSTIKVMS